MFSVYFCGSNIVQPLYSAFSVELSHHPSFPTGARNVFIHSKGANILDMCLQA